MNDIRGRGHRLTTNRQAVFEAVRSRYDHPTAAEVYTSVRQQRPHIAYGTVYNALHYLVDNGLLAEVRRPDGVVSYDRETRPHDHAICRVCGKLADVPNHATLNYTPIEQQTGFVIDAHRVEFIGRCPSCRAEMN